MQNDLLHLSNLNCMGKIYADNKCNKLSDNMSIPSHSKGPCNFTTHFGTNQTSLWCFVPKLEYPGIIVICNIPIWAVVNFNLRCWQKIFVWDSRLKLNCSQLFSPHFSTNLDLSRTFCSQVIMIIVICILHLTLTIDL